MKRKPNEVKTLIDANVNIADRMRNDMQDILNNCAAIIMHQGKANGIVIKEDLAITITKDLAENHITFPFGRVPGEALSNLDRDSLLELVKRYDPFGSEE